MYQTIDFSKTGGFPLTQDAMAFLQKAYNDVFSSLTAIFGTYAFISGATISGGTYNNGWITYNGEIVPFEGAPVSQGNYVAIVETISTVVYRDNATHGVIKSRKAVLSTDNTKPPVSGFTRLTLSSINTIATNALTAANNAQVTANNAQFPSGIILMWKGSIVSIPSGFTLCNGSNGTPDLRDKFIVGGGTNYPPGATGGSNTVVLGATQVPNHTHSINDPTHTHLVASQTGNNTGDFSPINSSFPISAQANYQNFNADYVLQGRNSGNANAGKSSATATGISINPTTGGGQPHENRPPFYALCFIMKT